MKQIGTRVTVLGGMTEFVGRTGEIIGNEKDGRMTLYRVRLDEPVDVPGVGTVKDDLWEGRFLKTIRPRKVVPPKLTPPQLAVMAAIMGLANAGQDHLFLGRDPQVTPEDAARQVVSKLGGCDPVETAVTNFGGGLFENEEMRDMFVDEAKAWVKTLRPMSIDKIKSTWRYGAFVDAIVNQGAAS